jgi:hypothetical protein
MGNLQFKHVLDPAARLVLGLGLLTGGIIPLYNERV